MDNYKNKINLNLRKYAGHLLQDSNIIAVGLGNKIINGYSLNIPTFTVIVEKKLSYNDVNYYTRIPKDINGILTDVIEVSNPVRNSISNNAILTPSKLSLPAYGGSSIRNAANPKIVGCMSHVMFDVDDNIFILSTADVLTRDEKMITDPSIPESIIYPGLPSELKDFFPPEPFKAGEPVELSKSVRVNKIIDPDPKDTDSFNVLNAGLAFVGNISNSLVSKLISPGVKPKKEILKRVKTVSVGSKVFKYSPTAGNVSGTVLTINTFSTVKLHSKNYLYRDQIIADIPYSEGDQGTLGLVKSDALIENADSVFGMCISGSSSNKKYSIFTPIVEITSAFKVGIFDMLHPY